MERLFVMAIILLSLTAQAADPEVKKWKRAGFTNAEFSMVNVPIAKPEIQATHLLDLSIVLFRNSGWTKAVIEAHLKRTNEIYTQCGIRLGEIKYIETDAYRGKLDINERWSALGDDYLISKATPIEERPIIYLMRSILPKRGTEGAFANIPNFWVELEPVVQNTIWLSNIINSESYGSYRDMDVDGKSYLKTRDPSYNVVAHEIAHLLGNMGHETEIKEKNLLNGDSDSLNDQLLPRQCESFKKSPLLRKI